MGITNKLYSYDNNDNILNLYKSLKSSHVEYCCQAWCPYLQDADNIEKVQ